MPGLTAWLPAHDEDDVGTRFRRALGLVGGTPSAELAVDAETRSAIVGHAGHPGYPVRSWHTSAATVSLEGHIYDRPAAEVERQLTAIFDAAMELEDPTTVISDFVGSADGDFLAFGVSHSGDRVIAFSDALGRLPTYLHDGPVGLVLSRDCKVIASLRGEWAFDRVGMAHQFWLGYPLGERTLFDGIERLPGAFLLDMHPTSSGTEVKRATTWTYRCDRTRDDGDLGRVAADVAERFATATLARALGSGVGAPVIVSASGGSDSRAVMAALSDVAKESSGGAAGPMALSFRRADGGQAADVRVAEQVAHALGLPWEAIDLPFPDPTNESALVWMKDGMNGVGMTFILPFLLEIVRRYGDRAVIFTGDGGDKVFPDLRPSRRPRTVEEAAEAIIDEAAMTDATGIERVLGLSAGSLMDDLRVRLAAYPESEPEDKIVRFLITERARKSLFEGEDRTRCLAWAATPFYALPVFTAAMAVPAAAKKDDRFYADVQRRLDPILLEIPHADFGLSIVSKRFYVRQAVRRLALRGFGSSARTLVKGAPRLAIAPGTVISDTLALLDEAKTRQSSTLGLVDEATARAAISEASTSTVNVWRTMLLVDRLWAERIASS